MKKTFSLMLSLFLGTALMVGCSAKKEVVSQEPEAKPTPDQTLHYTVKKHDTLWDIAGRSSIYGDSFQWPLLFKSNRDKIQDPDLIYPQQDFEYHKDVDSATVKEARDLASKTPKYKKHSKPVSKLPIDYF